MTRLYRDSFTGRHRRWTTLAAEISDRGLAVPPDEITGTTDIVTRILGDDYWKWQKLAAFKTIRQQYCLCINRAKVLESSKKTVQKCRDLLFERDGAMKCVPASWK